MLILTGIFMLALIAFAGWNYHGCNNTKPQPPVNLEEITNHLFQKVLHDKAENYRNPTNENMTSAQV